MMCWILDFLHDVRHIKWNSLSLKLSCKMSLSVERSTLHLTVMVVDSWLVQGYRFSYCKPRLHTGGIPHWYLEYKTRGEAKGDSKACIARVSQRDIITKDLKEEQLLDSGGTSIV